MDKIPQECRCIVSSFLGKRDHSNLVLTCKSFYDYFSPGNWREVELSGSPDELYHILGSFLDERYSPKHKFIK
jgi:hypothetical protein